MLPIIDLTLQFSQRVTRLGDLSPFGRLFKALGDNLFGPNRPNFWRLFGRFFKVDQNLKFLCYKIIIIAVNFQKNIFLKFWKKLGNFCFKKDPKYAFLPTKTSKNWLGDFGRLFSLNWATFYSNHLVTISFHLGSNPYHFIPVKIGSWFWFTTVTGHSTLASWPARAGSVQIRFGQ